MSKCPRPVTFIVTALACFLLVMAVPAQAAEGPSTLSESAPPADGPLIICAALIGGVAVLAIVAWLRTLQHIPS